MKIKSNHLRTLAPLAVLISALTSMDLPAATEAAQIEPDMSSPGDIAPSLKQSALDKAQTLDAFELSKDKEAMNYAQSLFASYCAECHLADGKGQLGYPNLSDQDWLHGGHPDNIKESIKNGRYGQMPAIGPQLGDEGLNQIAEYVKNLSQTASPDNASGTAIYIQQCARCHGEDGKGNSLIGAPDLTDNVWLYGESLEAIKISINHGGNGWMPSHGDFLSEEEVNLLTAFVYQLSESNH